MTKVPMTYEGRGTCEYMRIGIKPFLRMDYGSETAPGAKDYIAWYSVTDTGFRIVSIDVANSLERLYKQEYSASESSAHSPRPAPQG